TIETASGPLEIVVERMTRGRTPPVWLFSRATLDAIPDAYAEIDRVSIDRFLPNFLTRPRIGDIRLSAWLALVIVVPLLYRLIAVAGVVFRPLTAVVRRRYPRLEWSVALGPGPIRLFVLAIAIGWLVSLLELPLLERQFWAVVERILATMAVAWLLLRL